MNGGKTHGGRAYDSGYSAFQKKGLISPMQQMDDQGNESHGGITKYVKDGKTQYYAKKKGQHVQVGEKEFNAAKATSQQKKSAKNIDSKGNVVG